MVAPGGAIYDTIGVDYAQLRRPDPRIAAAILDGLGDARSVINVGAGAGSYEPTDRQVVAVEPSQVMIDQRPPGSARVLEGSADALPVPDDSADAALAILTVHHWPDRIAGLGEMRRVARDRVVILTFDPDVTWWLHDYFPQVAEIDAAHCPLSDFEAALGPLETRIVPIPHDCIDGFLGCWWRRPEMYLDARIRAVISTFLKFDVTDGVERLRQDLEDGTWRARYGHLLDAAEQDLGYRLLIAPV